MKFLKKTLAKNITLGLLLGLGTSALLTDGIVYAAEPVHEKPVSDKQYNVFLTWDNEIQLFGDAIGGPNFTYIFNQGASIDAKDKGGTGRALYVGAGSTPVTLNVYLGDGQKLKLLADEESIKVGKDSEATFTGKDSELVFGAKEWDTYGDAATIYLDENSKLNIDAGSLTTAGGAETNLKLFDGAQATIKLSGDFIADAGGTGVAMQTYNADTHALLDIDANNINISTTDDPTADRLAGIYLLAYGDEGGQSIVEVDLSAKNDINIGGFKKGIKTFGGGKIDLSGKNINIIADSDDSGRGISLNGYSAQNSSFLKMTASEQLTISGTYIGIETYDRAIIDASADTIKINGSDYGAIYSTGASKITLQGRASQITGDQRGIFTKGGSTIDILTDKTTIISGANSAVLSADKNSIVTIKGTAANIQSTGEVALWGESNGVINVNSSNINISGKDAAVVALDSATVNIGSADSALSAITENMQSGDNRTAGGKITAYLNNAGSVFKGQTVDIDWNSANADKGIYLHLNNSSLWQLDGNSFLKNLNTSAGIIDMTADKTAYSKLEIGTLAGTGSIFKQDIDVRSMESDKIFVKNDFSGSQVLDIYQKDNYVPVEGSNEGIGLVLASTNGDGVFTAKDREGTLFYTHYDLANKQSDTADYTTDWYLDKAVRTDDVTTSVAAILSANALNYHTWRTKNDKLLQRMGELRHNGEDTAGAWFRMNGSKIGRSGKFGFENKYTAYELGYDKLTKDTAEVKCYQGAAFSYTDGNSSYSSGSGDNSNKAISFYTTEIGNKGHYLDVVFKISNMDNDFAVYDTNSKKITGDFNNTGVSLSAEYGRKNTLQNSWYIEPQAQFTLGYLGGDNYTTNNGIEVSQSGIKSAVGRIGFNIGKEVGSKGIVYAKANLLHEFGGGYDVSMRDSSGALTVSDDFGDTWFEYGIGAAFKTGKNNHIYFDIERSAGSDFTKDWQWNAGARWTF